MGNICGDKSKTMDANKSGLKGPVGYKDDEIETQ